MKTKKITWIIICIINFTPLFVCSQTNQITIKENVLFGEAEGIRSSFPYSYDESLKEIIKLNENYFD